MDRRTFLQTAGIAAATGIILPKQGLAAQGGILAGPQAGALFYTGENPGRWAKKIDGHLPVIEKSASMVEITTPHSMDGFKHYIIKHQLFDAQFNLLGEKIFDPEMDSPTSEFSIKNVEGEVYALSMCNLHDSWINSLKV